MYKDKTILITGASRGVGLELSKYFISNGAKVLGLSRQKSLLEHPDYFQFLVDIGDAEAVQNCFRKEISKQTKKIDIVINNASVLTSQYAMIMPAKNAIDMVNVNLLGTFFVSREAAKLMRKNEYGRIINISSMAISLEPAGDSIYAATKVGVQTLANIMAKEFSSLSITCNTVCITAIQTDMLNQHSGTAKEKISEIIGKLPVPRMAENEDIFNVIDFFASPQSSYITAQTLYLGGIN